MNDASLPLANPAVPSLTHVDALPVGTKLGEFEVQGLLGVGGFGMVYRGYDHSLHRSVAIKEYMPSSLVGRVENHAVSARSSADELPFQNGLKSFIAEARLLARFDHPSLVKVYRFWEANQTAYMAMPLYQGMTLKQARALMSGPPPEEWLRAVLWSVLEALKVLHASNTLHRDVSPDNIFLQDVGPPVLLDLGAARRAITEGSHKHTAVLKVNYAPIEQYADAQDLSEGPWTDLYSLGALVHSCLCNEAPLPATFRVLRDRMPSCAQVAKTAKAHFGVAYSERFTQAIDHALAIQPADRPQSVEALALELDLQVPVHLSQFNWRQALGGVVTLGGQPGAAGAFGAPSSGLADAKTELIPPTSQSAHGEVQSPMPVVRTTVAPRRWWVFAVVLVIAILAALAYVNRAKLQPAPPPTPVPIPSVGGNSAAAGARAEGKGLCADVPFYKRAWCIHKACQKPGMAHVPACVQERKSQEDAAKRAPSF